MDNLISFDGVGEVAGVANNLINKVASAVGWVANYKTPKKIAMES